MTERFAQEFRPQADSAIGGSKVGKLKDSKMHTCKRCTLKRYMPVRCTHVRVHICKMHVYKMHTLKCIQIGMRKALSTASFRSRSKVQLAGKVWYVYDWRRRGHYGRVHTYARTATSATAPRRSHLCPPKKRPEFCVPTHPGRDLPRRITWTER